MPKANAFVCTLVPVKNLMVSSNLKEFYESTSWLEKVFSPALSLVRTDCLIGWLVKGRWCPQQKTGVEAVTARNLDSDSCLSSDLQQTLATISGGWWCVKYCGRCPFMKENLDICCVSRSVIALWVDQPEFLLLRSLHFS